MGNDLWTKTSMTSNWTNIPGSGSVTDITSTADGKILKIVIRTPQVDGKKRKFFSCGNRPQHPR